MHNQLNLSLVLGFSVTIPQFAMNMPAPALPQIGTDLQVSSSSLPFVITLYLVGYAMAVLLAGGLAERWGARRVHLWGTMGFCLASLMCVTESWPVLLLSRFLQALCGCGVTVLARLIVQQRYPQASQLGIITALALAVALSPSVAPLLGGAWLEIGSWRGIFLVLAGMGACSLLGFLLCVPEDNSVDDQAAARKRTNPSGSMTTSPGHESGRTLESADWSFTLRQSLQDTRHPDFRRYVTTISLVSMSQIAFLANSAWPVQHDMGVSASDYGFMLGLVALGFVLGTQLSRRGVPLLGTWPILRAAALLAAACGMALVACALCWPHAPWSLMLPMFGIMTSVGMVVPATQAGLLRIPARKPGYLASLFFFTQISFSSLYGMGVAALDMHVLTLAIVVALPCLVLGGLALRK
mgnify:FL=1